MNSIRYILRATVNFDLEAIPFVISCGCDPQKYDSWWDNKSGNRLIHALLKQENQGPRVSVSD